MQSRSLIHVLHENPTIFVRPLVEVEREHIERAMILCAGNLQLAGTRLGISRATLYRKLQSYAHEDLRIPISKTGGGDHRSRQAVSGESTGVPAARS